MEKKAATVLIGCSHVGIKNAEKVIKELEQNNIKKGDLVAIEGLADEHVSGMKKFIRKYGFVNAAVLYLHSGKNNYSSLSLNEAFGDFNKYSVESEHVWFNFCLLDFFIEKKVRLLGLENARLNRRFQKLTADRMSGTELDKRKERLWRLMAVPLREKFWKNKLLSLGEQPRFILVGAGHLSALKRIVPCQKVVDLSEKKAGLTERVKRELELSSLRLAYRTRQAKRKIFKIRKFVTIKKQ